MCIRDRGDADQPAMPASPHRIHQRADSYAPQPTPLEPRHLFGEAPRRHAQLVRILGDLGHAVIHQDHRHVAQLHQGHPPGQAGGQGHISDDLIPGPDVVDVYKRQVYA